MYVRCGAVRMLVAVGGLVHGCASTVPRTTASVVETTDESTAHEATDEPTAREEAATTSTETPPVVETPPPSETVPEPTVDAPPPAPVRVEVGYDGVVRSPSDLGDARDFAGTIVVEGHAFEGNVTVDDRRHLTSVDLVASASDAELRAFRAFVLAVRRRARAVCESPRTPSPLGTPDPTAPDAWDPVRVTTVACHGTLFGLPVSTTEEERSASDFRNLRLEIVGP